MEIVINLFEIGAQITSFSGRRVLDLRCKDTRMRVQVIVREQLTLSMTNMRNYLDVYSLVSSYLDTVVV